jgi:hypothetical protein
VVAAPDQTGPDPGGEEAATDRTGPGRVTDWGGRGEEGGESPTTRPVSHGILSHAPQSRCRDTRNTPNVQVQ